MPSPDWNNPIIEMEAIIGLTFDKVFEEDDGLTMIASTGELFFFGHSQDCCESVYLDEVSGDLDDLVGSEILHAEESSHDGDPKSEYDESNTWTFYKLATRKGWVDLKFYGTSNGYYSEAVHLYLIKGSD